MADNRRWTVAHEAARKGWLPPGFDAWDLRDNEGVTVRDVFVNPCHYPE
jgi:hypothetical protein